MSGQSLTITTAFVADTPLCRVDMEIVEKVLPGVKSGRVETVLDLGCGVGRASVPLAQRGYDVVAVDLSQSMLQRMATKAAASSVIDRVFPVRANLVELDCFADGSADHAICLFSTLGMIQGRENRREMLRHRGPYRALRRNICSACSQPMGGDSRISWLTLLGPVVVAVASRSFCASSATPRTPIAGSSNMFLHRFSRRELARDLGHCGWHVETIWPISIDGAKIVPKATLPGGFIVLCRLPARNSSAKSQSPTRQ